MGSDIKPDTRLERFTGNIPNLRFRDFTLTSSILELILVSVHRQLAAFNFPLRLSASLTNAMSFNHKRKVCALGEPLADMCCVLHALGHIFVLIDHAYLITLAM